MSATRPTLSHRLCPSFVIASLLCVLPGLAEAAIAYVNAAGSCDFPGIQEAINGLPAGSEIRLAGSEFLLSGPLQIGNRHLRIAGGYPACGAPAPTGKTELRAGHTGDPVVSVLGNIPAALNLQLADLVITGGDNPAGGGGGLRISGFGSVSLSGVDVHDNMAETGGGIHASELGGVLSLSLLDGTRIGNMDDFGNMAVFGGGIFCAGSRIRLGHAHIVSNIASNQGGGLFATDGCEVLSANANGDLRIEHNRARMGGGIHATGQAQLTLRSRPTQKISIRHNAAVEGAAPQSGGGASLSGAGTRLRATGVHIDNNLARGFAAGLLIAGSEVTMDRDTDGCLLGDDACSSLSGNEVRDAAGNLAGTSAAALVAGGGAPLLSLAHTRVTGNAAGSSILAVGDDGMLALSSVLIAANQSNSGLLQGFGNGRLRGDFLTIADNLNPGAPLFSNSTAPVALELRRSIVLVEPGVAHVSGAGSTVFECLNTGPGGALGGSSDSPGFADRADGRYRLAADSPNLDRCSADGAEGLVDIAGFPRVVDRPEVANGMGAADRGAYEDIDRLFTNGFEE